MSKYTIFSLCVLACTLTSVVGLLEQNAKEQACFPITKTVPLDVEWLSSVKRFYNPLLSRLELYRATKVMSGKSYEDLTEPEVYYDSCGYFQLDTKTEIRSNQGFNGKMHQYKYKGLDANLERYEYSSMTLKDDESFPVTCYTTDTDNSTYLVNACCTKDNQMTWTVTSSVKTLPKETVLAIHDHVTSLGFKKEYFTAFKFEACPDNDKI